MGVTSTLVPRAPSDQLIRHLHVFSKDVDNSTDVVGIGLDLSLEASCFQGGGDQQE